MSRLLIVEDEVNSAQALAYYFRSADYVVDLAGRADEARAAAEENWPDLLLTDLVLRGDADGMHVARELQRQDPDLPVVAMSGLPEEEVRQRTADVNVHQICLKPLRLHRLGETVKSALAQRGTQGGGTQDREQP